MSTPGFSFPPPPPPPPPQIAQDYINFETPNSGRGFGNNRGNHRGRGRSGSSRGQRGGNYYRGAANGDERHSYTTSRPANSFYQPRHDANAQPSGNSQGAQSSKPFFGQQGYGDHGVGSVQSTHGATAYHAGFNGQPGWMGQPMHNATPAARHAAKAANAFLGPGTQAPGVTNVSKGKAPPAVPSFGFSLPVAPSPTRSDANPFPGKKRKHNQLGLTPQAEEHESSEDDVDEESRLGATVKTGGLAFMHKGKLCALKSREDIVAWIAERRKCYPTKARVAEKAQRAMAERKSRHPKDPFKPKSRKPNGQTKHTPEPQDLIHVRSLVDEAEVPRQTQLGQIKTLATTGAQKPDKATKAKLKAEKLREKFERAQRRAEKLESKQRIVNDTRPRKARDRTSESPLRQAVKSKRNGREQDLTEDETNPFKAHHNRKSLQPNQGSSSPEVMSLKRHQRPPGSASSDEGSSSSDPEDSELSKSENKDGNEKASSSDSSALTSTTSSDSESSGDSESDASSSAPPSPHRIRTSAPTRVPPPARAAQPHPLTKRQPCHALQRRGYCPRGDSCHFSHDPTRLNRERGKTAAGRGRNGRGGKHQEAERKPLMTLYQRLLARQLEEEAEAEAVTRDKGERRWCEVNGSHGRRVLASKSSKRP